MFFLMAPVMLVWMVGCQQPLRYRATMADFPPIHLLMAATLLPLIHAYWRDSGEWTYMSYGMMRSTWSICAIGLLALALRPIANRLGLFFSWKAMMRAAAFFVSAYFIMLGIKSLQHGLPLSSVGAIQSILLGLAYAALNLPLAYRGLPTNLLVGAVLVSTIIKAAS